jgi:hypothetical protein
MAEVDRRLLSVFETIRHVRKTRNGIRPNDVREMIEGVGVEETIRVIEQARQGRGIVVIRTKDELSGGITLIRILRVK